MKLSFHAFRSNTEAFIQTIRLNLNEALSTSEGHGDELTRAVGRAILLSADNIKQGVTAMTPRLGDAIHHARRTRKLTLRQLAEQVTKDDGTPISPQYLND